MNYLKGGVSVHSLAQWTATLLMSVAILGALSERFLPSLVSNAALVALLPNLMPSPPQPEDLLGWTDRSESPPFASEPGFQEALDRVRSSRTRAGILTLTGQLALAEQLLLAISPSDSLVSYWLALVYEQQHRPTEAIEVLRSVPGIAAALAQLGADAEGDGNYQRAMGFWEMSLLFDTNDRRGRAYVLEKLSRTAYGRFGDFEGAIRWGNRWCDFLPGAKDCYIWVASLYLWDDLPEDAALVLQRGAPYGVQTSKYYHGQMGQIQQSRGQWEEAIQSYRVSLEENRDDGILAPYMAWYLGAALCHEHRCQEGRPYLEIAGRSGPATLQQQAATLLGRIDTEHLQ